MSQSQEIQISQISSENTHFFPFFRLKTDKTDHFKTLKSNFSVKFFLKSQKYSFTVTLQKKSQLKNSSRVPRIKENKKK